MQYHLGVSLLIVVYFIQSTTAASAFAGDTPFSVRTVVMEGESAPGTGPSEIFGAFGAASIDDSGNAGFVGYVSGPGGNSDGFWVEDGGALSLLVRRGDAVPGFPSGTTFQGIDPYPTLGKVVSSGFKASLEGPEGSTPSIWKRTNGATSLITKTGDPAPGLGANARFNTVHSPVCSGVDSFVFYATTTDDTAVTTPSIWQTHNTGLSLAARRGEPAPGAAPGVNFDNFVISSLAGNASGQSLFLATVVGPGLPGGVGRGLWLSDENSLSLVAATGTPVPGLPDGATLGTIISERFLLNRNGRTAFASQMTLKESPFSEIGVYVAGGDSLRLVAKENDQAPGLPSGVRLGQFQDPHLPISRYDRTAFSVQLAGPGVDNSNRQAVFSEGLGELALLAREGDHAPGTSAGVLFNDFLRVELSGSGQALFQADLRGSGVTSSNRTGLWAQTPEGEARLVVRAGTPFEYAPGMSKIVSYFDFMGNSAGSLFDGSRAQSFNDRGDIALSIAFTDGSSGVFVVSTPEPASLMLLLIGSALLRRKSARRQVE